jgi:hypothetical protein
VKSSRLKLLMNSSQEGKTRAGLGCVLIGEVVMPALAAGIQARLCRFVAWMSASARYPGAALCGTLSPGCRGACLRDALARTRWLIRATTDPNFKQPSAFSRAKRPEVCGILPQKMRGSGAPVRRFFSGCRKPFRGCGASLQQGRRLPALRYGFFSGRRCPPLSTRAAHHPLPPKAGELASSSRTGLNAGRAGPGRPGSELQARPQGPSPGCHPLAPR